jgi:hypothetical protein
MKELEESLLRRWKGLRIVAFSFVLAFVGLVPLFVYMTFGATDGNPIGLGLFSFLALGIATVGVLIGLITLLMEVFASEQY